MHNAITNVTVICVCTPTTRHAIKFAMLAFLTVFLEQRFKEKTNTCNDKAKDSQANNPNNKDGIKRPNKNTWNHINLLFR